MPFSKISKQNIAQSISPPSLACLLLIIHPDAISSHALAPNRPNEVKENLIHLTRPPSNIAPGCSSDAHVPIVVTISGGQETLWAL